MIRRKRLPAALGGRPAPPRVDDPSGPLLLEHLSEFEGWAVLTEQGRQVNPCIRTAAALAFYLCRERLTARITNLEVLPPALQRVAKGLRYQPLSP